MGIEVLTVFLVFPVIFWIADILLIIRGRNARKHLALMCFGIVILSLFALGASLLGYETFDGIIVGSALYGPVYIMAWFAITVMTSHPNRQQSGGNT